jgi:hypothetical protein
VAAERGGGPTARAVAAIARVSKEREGWRGGEVQSHMSPVVVSVDVGVEAQR